ncbi:MAG TPA: hypothetical protein VNE62_08605 [Actinomycetota bacterium]|nr:hypothetical protein [Actinomycetota bacterium]
MIDQGTRAPDIDTPSTTGHFRLAEALERGPVVLWFYPLPDTPG